MEAAAVDEIVVEIPGDAVPQPRARSTRGGRMYTPAGRVGPFKQAVGLLVTAAARRARWKPVEGLAYIVDIQAVFGRPPSHLAAGGGLRTKAPRWPGHNCGDVDNLEKAILDAITATPAWGDDTQVVDGRCRKRYAERGEPARTLITIRRV